MEDSRNIIKAIDALTLKAGGEVVDSKNITEAIDRLKEVYSQEAIGIDDTLTQEGLAADAKAVGDFIQVVNAKTDLNFSSVSDMNTKISKLTTLRTYTFCTSASDILSLFNIGNSTIRGIFTRPNIWVVDFTVWVGLTTPTMYTFRLTLSDNTISNKVMLPTRSEMDALKPQIIQDISLSSAGVGDTGISSTDYYITQPLVINKTETYCQTFAYDGHWCIRVANINDDSAVTETVNVSLLKILVS